MKTRWTGVAASVALASFISVSTVQAGEIVDRERRQQERIGQGVQSGELTAKETQRLEKQQGKIEADREKALADGKMTKKERAKLRTEQNRASYHIYRQKTRRPEAAGSEVAQQHRTADFTGVIGGFGQASPRYLWHP